MSDASTAKTLTQDPIETAVKNKDKIIDKYKELNDKVEVVLEKINKRKSKKKTSKS